MGTAREILKLWEGELQGLSSVGAAREILKLREGELQGIFKCGSCKGNFEA